MSGALLTLEVMQQFRREVSIERDGLRICERATLIQQGEPRATPIQIPGQGTGYKDASVRGPTLIQIDGAERGFREELETLLALSRDDDLRRRNRGWAPRPVTIRVDGEPFDGCRISRPINPYGSIEAVEFGLEHDEL